MTWTHYVLNQYILYVLQTSKCTELLCAFDNVYQARTMLMASHSKWAEPTEDNVIATKSLEETPVDSDPLGTNVNPIKIDHTPLSERRTRRVETTKEPSQETGNDSVEADTV